MISEAVERLLNEGGGWYGDDWYEMETLTYEPYQVFVKFTDHAIEREFERDIKDEDVIRNLKLVIKDIIRDYAKRKIQPEGYIKVIDRDTCMVAVCGVSPTLNKKRIQKIVVVTCYIWDGRVNVDGPDSYYVGEESVDYIVTKQWNEEHQDLVMSYSDWKYNRDIRRQKKRADNEHYWRNNPREIPMDRKWELLNKSFDKNDEYQKNGQKIRMHKSLPDGDLDAIRDFHKNMDSQHIELEPVYESSEKWAKEGDFSPFNGEWESYTENPDRLKSDKIRQQKQGNSGSVEDYADLLAGKNVYCPFSGPSHPLYKWLAKTVPVLKKGNTLVATTRKQNGKPCGSALIHYGGPEPLIMKVLKDDSLTGKECLSYLTGADVVISEPPASEAKTLIDLCEKYGKKYIIKTLKNGWMTNLNNIKQKNRGI